MKKRHKFIAKFSIRDGVLVVEDPAIVRQMQMVLHLASGEECVFGDGAGKDVVVRITAYEKHRVTCEIVRQETNMNEARVMTTLACAILKSDHFTMVVEKATELGVREIVPLITARTIKKDVNLPRLEIIAREAAEQSDRGFVPIISAPMPLSRFITIASSPAVVLEKDGVLSTIVGDVAQLTFVVGPEGGWTDDEVAMMREKGFLLRSLGTTTLRAETAAIVGTYLGTQGML